jgi:hypothetical protein
VSAYRAVPELLEKSKNANAKKKKNGKGFEQVV